MTAENLKIGARGWRHPQWVGSYYPDDLPEEWQLTYYANDFRVVLIPVEYWESSIGYDLDEWLEAVGDDFRFYLECPSFENDEDMQRFHDQCVEMDDLLGGVISAEDDNVDRLDLKCPVIRAPSLKTDNLCIGILNIELDDLRLVRVWLEEFDRSCETRQKIAFVTDGNGNDGHIEAILKIRTLSEMMGL